MTIRTFRDPNGIEWRVYTLVPKGLERRNRPDRRRGSDSSYTGPERRQQQDRRQRAREGPNSQPQAWVLPGIQGGWLVFDSGAERRRLTPIPPGWETATEAELDQLCRLAMMP
jgi:hypothetical protein